MTRYEYMILNYETKHCKSAHVLTWKACEYNEFSGIRNEEQRERVQVVQMGRQGDALDREKESRLV